MMQNVKNVTDHNGTQRLGNKERAIVEYEANPNIEGDGLDVLRDAILRSASDKDSSLTFTISFETILDKGPFPEVGANVTELIALARRPIIFRHVVTVVIEGPHANAFIPTLMATLDNLFAPRLTTSVHPATVDDNR